MFSQRIVQGGKRILITICYRWWNTLNKCAYLLIIWCPLLSWFTFSCLLWFPFFRKRHFHRSIFDRRSLLLFLIDAFDRVIASHSFHIICYVIRTALYLWRWNSHTHFYSHYHHHPGEIHMMSICCQKETTELDSSKKHSSRMNISSGFLFIASCLRQGKKHWFADAFLAHHHYWNDGAPVERWNNKNIGYVDIVIHARWYSILKWVFIRHLSSWSKGSVRPVATCEWLEKIVFVNRMSNLLFDNRSMIIAVSPCGKTIEREINWLIDSILQHQ